MLPGITPCPGYYSSMYAMMLLLLLLLARSFESGIDVHRLYKRLTRYRIVVPEATT